MVKLQLVIRHINWNNVVKDDLKNVFEINNN